MYCLPPRFKTHPLSLPRNPFLPSGVANGLDCKANDMHKECLKRMSRPCLTFFLPYPKLVDYNIMSDIDTPQVWKSTSYFQ